MNKTFKLLPILVIIPSMFLLSFKNKESQKAEYEVSTKSFEVNRTSNLGEKLYNTYCLSCHQKNGKGIPRAFPPLVNNPVVSGDKEALIKIVLNGVSGLIEVNGIKYNSVMMGLKNTLKDEEVAEILNYLRTEKFGNKASKISAQEVKALR